MIGVDGYIGVQRTGLGRGASVIVRVSRFKESKNDKSVQYDANQASTGSCSFRKIFCATLISLLAPLPTSTT
jgi:hypothetical protein